LRYPSHFWLTALDWSYDRTSLSDTRIDWYLKELYSEDEGKRSVGEKRGAMKTDALAERANISAEPSHTS
jgi:hypothetical protein